MTKVTQPNKEFWKSDKKLAELKISERKIGKTPPTHNVGFIGKAKKKNK